MIDYKLEKSLKKVLGGFSRQDFASLTQFLHSSYMGWFLFILMVVALSLTLSFHVSYLPSDVKLGQKAPKLNKRVLKLALSAYHKASSRGAVKKPVLTVIDYSLPSSISACST